MPMRPEDLMMLMQQLGRGGPPGGQNPMASAIGKYASPPVQQPSGVAPRPAPPPMAPPPPPMAPPTDEDMLNQVSDSMGGDEGDMETAKQALVEMYQNGDPSDPQTLEQWRQAKQDFIDQYGEENLPDLPNDPGETTSDGEGETQYADDARRRQSEDTYGRELKRLGKRSTVVS
jgi:hypothetical protein